MPYGRGSEGNPQKSAEIPYQKPQANTLSKNTSPAGTGASNPVRTEEA